MSNNVAVQQPRSLDEFADWTDEVESHNEEISERAIIGQSVSLRQRRQISAARQ